ncbi:MAG: FIST N-terminal domain-containing protein, partial [Acidimicrobiales bacterium]|nr:FIST N-terminal domain-containing protein [Acidimicrobiales bacterium]
MEPRAAGPVRRARWMNCGHSADPQPFTAGAKAAVEAVRGRADAKLLIVFCSAAYDLDQLLAGIASEAPGTPLIGCSTAGEIATAGPSDASVVIVAIGGPGFSVATGAGTDSTGALRQATTTAVEACMGSLERRDHSVLLLLTDGLGG